jgi:hypothetical protein
VKKTRTAVIATLAACGMALLSGCAVVTGPYAAQRAPNASSSRSMVSRFDLTQQSSMGGRSFSYPARANARADDLFSYRYY